MPTEAWASGHVHKPRQTGSLANAGREICILSSYKFTANRSSFKSIQVALQRLSIRNSISAKCQVGRWLANSNRCMKYIPPFEPERTQISVKQKGYSLDERNNAKSKSRKTFCPSLSRATSGCTVAADERSSGRPGVPVSRLHPHAPPMSFSLAHSHSLFWCTPLPSNR